MPRPPHPIEPHSKPWQSASIAVKLKQAVVVNSSEIAESCFHYLTGSSVFLAKEAGALPFIYRARLVGLWLLKKRLQLQFFQWSGFSGGTGAVL